MSAKKVGFGTFVVLALSLLLVGTAAAQPVYGIASGKACAGPINVGDQYVCVASIDNTNSTSLGTVTTDQVSDQVFHPDGTTAGAPFTQAINSSTVFPAGPVHLVDNGIAPAPSCDALKCTIPFGDHITVTLSHYTAQLQDVGVNPDPTLSDAAVFRYRQVCDLPVEGNPCSTSINFTGAGAATDVNPISTTTVTQIHNAAHAVVTSVPAGTTVHDFVTVSSPAGQPAPTGTVRVDWFTNGGCTGDAQSSMVETLVAGAGSSSTVDATDFTKTPAAAGSFAFRAHYLGDGNTPSAFSTSDGDCEPLNVVDANIQITPQTATNPVGTNHTLTVHVNVNPGTGFVNAPDGTVINLSLTNSNGATATFVGPSSCTTSGGTGSCTVVISSPTAGHTAIHASTNVTVSGVPLTRATSDGLAGDSPDAGKDWVSPGGLIAPTQTTCQDFISNTAATLDAVNYSLTGGNKIGQGINPGVFFFYTKITTTVPNQVVTVGQSNTSTNNTPLFGIQNGQAWLWTADCTSKIVGTTSGPNDSAASYTIPTPGTYIISVKYQTKSIAGAPAPVPANITYNFTTSLGGSTGGSVLLKKQ